MTHIFPADEADNLVTGDLLYAYVETTLFPVHRKEPTAIPGLDQIVVESEDVSTTLCAQIRGDSFSARWIIGKQPPQQIALTGIPFHNEAVARRYFPSLADYQFKETM